MQEDEKIIEENWAGNEWEARAKGYEGENATPEEKLTKEVLDAEHRARLQEADHEAEEELQQQDVPLPEPSLISLTTGLAAQAMVSMGVFPNPATGKNLMLLNQASHLIDTIDLLYEKTTGNRTNEETQTLENVLHELRMIYLAAEKEKQRRNRG